MKRIQPILLALVLRVLLDLIYYFNIAPRYPHLGFGIDLVIFNYIVSLVLVLPLAALLKEKVDSIRSMTTYALYIGILIPLSSLYGLANRSIAPLLTAMVSFLIIYLLSSRHYFTRHATYTWYHGKLASVILSCLFIVGTIVWFVVAGGLDYFNLNPLKVYEYRSDVSALLNRSIFAYSNMWAMKIFAPFLFLYFIVKRNYLMTGLTILIILFFFGVSANKIVILMPIFAFAIYVVFGIVDRGNILLSIVIGCVGVIWIATLFFDNNLPVSLLIRRLLYIPAQLTYDYWNFFELNPKVWWSNSILKSFIDYPYRESIPVLIAGYKGMPDGHANNGFISLGYAHAGYLGVMIYSALFGILIKVLDFCAQSVRPRAFILALVSGSIYTIIASADFSSAILTHGILWLVVLLGLLHHHELSSHH